MGVRDEALEMLRGGMSPAGIARQRGVTLSTILGYLDEMVGKGRLRRSDILFSVPALIRRPVLQKMEEKNGASFSTLKRAVVKSGTDPDDDEIKVVMTYGDSRHALGDVYDDVRKIEVGLHNEIRQALEAEFGSGEFGWWRKGIPEMIRKTCQSRREEDQSPAEEPYSYTDLIDLRTIIEKQWSVVSQRLPPLVRSNKKSLLDDLLKLNHVRRLVMHPVRGTRPTEADFEFLLDLKRRLGFA